MATEDPFPGLQDALARSSQGIGAMSAVAGDLDTQMVVVANQFQALTEVSGVTAKAMLDMASATAAAGAAAQKAKAEENSATEAKTKAAKATADAKAATDAFFASVQKMGDSLKGLTDGSTVAASSISMVSAALTMLGIAAGPFTAIAMAVKGIVDAVDESKKQFREYVYALNQGGSAYADNAALATASAQKVKDLAASWGKTAAEGAVLVQGFTGAGVGARQGETGDARTKSIASETGAALNAAAAASHAFGIKIDKSAEYTTAFGVVMNLQGPEFARVMADIGDAGRKSALGSKLQLETVKAATEANKEWAPSVMGLNILTSAFSKEIKAGTLSMETISKMAIPAKLGTEGLAYVASMAQRSGMMITDHGQKVLASSVPFEKAMVAIARGGEALNEQMKTGKVDPKAAEESAKFVINALRETAKQAGGMSDMAKKLMADAVLKTDLSYAAVESIFEKDIGVAAKDLASSAQATAKADPAQKMIAGAQVVYDKFKTSGEALQGVASVFSDSVRAFGDYVRDLKGPADSLSKEFDKRSKESSFGYAGATVSMGKDIVVEGAKEVKEGMVGAAHVAGSAKGVLGTAGAVHIAIQMGDIALTKVESAVGIERGPIHDALMDLESRIYKTLTEHAQQASVAN